MISSKDNHRLDWKCIKTNFLYRNVAQDELDAAEAGKNIGYRSQFFPPKILLSLRMAILSFISIITLIFYFFVKNALSVIRVGCGLTVNCSVVLEVSLNVLGFLQTTGRKSEGAG